MAIHLMAEAEHDLLAPRVCTIIARAHADQARALGERMGQPVQAFILDGDGTDELGALLGGQAERFAAGFDEAELVLVVLPRLLLRMLDEGACAAAYVDVDAELRGAVMIPDGTAVRVNPWPPRPGADVARLSAIVVPASEGVRSLLARWSDLAAGVLDEDRRLSAHTTLRWLRALAAAIPEVQIEPAGLIPEGAASPRNDDAERPGELSDATYGFASLTGGIPLTTALRRLLRRSPFSRPFSALDTRELLAWVAEPAAPPRAIPRYLAVLSDVRPDLRDAFGARSGENDAALLAWAQTEGRAQDPVLAMILPAAATETDGLAPRPGGRSVPDIGVNAVSYWRAELGIADAARLLVAGLDAARVPVQPVAVPGASPPSRHDAAFAAVSPENPGFAINLLALNPDGLLAFREETGAAFFAGRANIGYWWWEVLDAFPDAWRPAFELVQEVWVGSNHVREAIAPASPVPVRLVPIPVLPLPERRARSELHLPRGFLFVTMFDYNSAFERKNPLATVQAFRDAFPPGSGASLVVKSINGDNAPDNRDELAILADGHPDIHLVESYVSAADADGLLACADCVVSLHRAEGFGIPLARALRSGIPVVATAYGGNLDFMTEENSFLVRCRPATVPKGTIYPGGAAWVDPEPEHAVAQLRGVFEHPARARARATLAAAALAERYSPESTGARMALELGRVRLETARSAGLTAAVRELPPALAPALIEDLRARIRTPLDALGGTSPGAQLARRSLDRVSRPINERQRAIDERLLDALSSLVEAHERHTDALGQLQDRLSTAPATAIAELARELRRDRAEVDAALAELRAQARGLGEAGGGAGGRP